jgi:potassium efflux system protein
MNKPLHRAGIAAWLGLLALIATLALTLPLAAQDPATKSFDFAAWEVTASRAEELIATGDASTPALETLRETLVTFRSAALAAMDASQARVDTLKSQIEALGPAPEAGVIEAEEVATRRAQLAEQLTKASGPVLAAQEAYQRAAGLITEIDRIIRDRLASQFFSLGPSPINPANWVAAYDTTASFMDSVFRETLTATTSPPRVAEIRQNLPLTALLLVIGFLLLTRARHWILKASGVIPRATLEAMNDSRQLILSLTQIAVPMLGIWAIMAGLENSGFLGYRGTVLASALPMVGVSIFGAGWLGRTLFNSAESAPQFFDLPVAQRRTGRVLARLMGLVLALDYLLETINSMLGTPIEAQVVLAFPVLIVGGLLLVRMGLLLHPVRRVVSDVDPTENFLKQRVIALISKAAVVVGVVGPVLAAIGYFTAADSTIIPAIKTLALLGVALLSYGLMTKCAEAWSSAGRLEEPEAETRDVPQTFIPVIVGFVLICVITPLIALVWGARVADLMEVWATVNDGFTVGDRRFSAVDFLFFAAVFGGGYTLTRLLQSALRTSVLPRTRLDSGGRNALLTGTGYVGIFLSALAAITSAGLDLSSIALVAGALSVGIGFGLQAIVSNFVSGIILLVERPIKEGDWVEVGSYSGYVQKISVRATEIETFDRATVVVPNADFISGAVINYTHSNLKGRVRVPIGVAYGSDPREIEKILLEIAHAHPMVDARSDPNVVFMGFGADSMDFEIRVIIKDVNWMLSVKSDMNYEIVKRFGEAGIEIPFAQRDINLKNVRQIAEAFRDRPEEEKS